VLAVLLVPLLILAPCLWAMVAQVPLSQRPVETVCVEMRMKFGTQARTGVKFPGMLVTQLQPLLRAVVRIQATLVVIQKRY
ncbi:MAG: hypothetical protein ACK5RO_02510, partial [Pseudobdellovibrionaceae bacterium]